MTFKYSHDEQERREPKLIFLAHTSSPCTQILAWLSIRFSMLPNLTNQYISYSMAVFSANEIRTFFSIREVVSFFDLLSCPKYMNTIPLTICEILCILQKNLFRVTNTTTFVPILCYFLLECYISRIAGGASLNFQSWHQNYKNCYRKVLSVTAK